MVKADGKLAGAINTDSTGSGRLDLVLYDPPKGAQQLPASIALGGVHLIDVVNEGGQVVLSESY